MYVPTTEQCDDGDLINGNGCSSTCTIEAGFVCDTLATGRSNCYGMPVQRNYSLAKISLSVMRLA